MVRGSSELEAVEDLEESKSTASELSAFSEGSGGGGFIPKDSYQISYMRTVPNSSELFPDKLDKDVVLANVSEKEKPTSGELAYLLRAVQLTDDLFVKPVDKFVVDERNQPVKDDSGKVRTVRVLAFDNFWLPVRNVLISQYKFKLNISRAMGKDREAVLGKSNIVQKSVVRGREAQKSSFGLGGMQ